MLKKLLMSSVATVAMTVASLSGTPAQAAESSFYNQLGDWRIMVDQTLGNGCFAYAAYKQGSVIRLGFDKKNGGIFMLFGNANWEHMDVGQSYPMRFLFDNDGYFDGEPTVVKMGEHTYLYIKTHGEFMGEFARRNSLKIIMKSNGKQLMHVSLTGTYAAAVEVLRCQGAQDGRNYLSN